ncbi:hypothetical protein [Nannocystis pusilla]|uniref:hypothetical protein n=1 Tax=Nannocystis pusilla TaxID=889268 RepID=UPI003B7ABAD1
MGGRGRESQIPAVLEVLGIPNTGSGPFALALALDKGVAKIFAAAHGIRTAPFQIVGADEALGPVELAYPLFVKPVAEGSSMGIRKDSVCHDEAALRERVARLQRDYRQAVLIEEFLSGDEFTVGVVGNGAAAEVVGVMQVTPRVADGQDFVYSLEVKRDYLNQVRYVMTDELLQSGRLDAARLAAIRGLALDVHRVFGCRDLSRIDIRCDRRGDPNFIEVNPLPGLHPVSSDLVIIARGHGWSYEQLIGRIIGAATQRWSSLDRPQSNPRTLVNWPSTSPEPHADRHHLPRRPLSDPPVALLGAPELSATAREVHAALAPDHECVLVPVGDSVPAALAAVRAAAPDVVFNLCEGAIGRTQFEAHLALGLDMLGIPCCGCDPVTLALCQDKPFVKQFLRQTGVPTPDGFAVAPGCSEEHVLEDIRELIARAASGRVIVKPAREGEGVGVDAGSVCGDAESALRARARCGPATTSPR